MLTTKSPPKAAHASESLIVPESTPSHDGKLLRVIAWKHEAVSRIKQSWKGMLVASLLSALVGFVFLTTPFGEKLIFLSYDLPYLFRPYVQPDEVAMVYLDEDSERVLQQPANQPWDRALHAQLLKRLTAEKAKAVVFDIVFLDATNPDSDEQFARAIQENGKVVLAVDSVPLGYGTSGASQKKLFPPYAPFRRVAAALGSAETRPDTDMVIRQHLPQSPDDQIPSLSWAAASLLGAPITRIPEMQYAHRWINYYGPNTVLPGLSFHKVITPNDPDARPGFFRDKVVFVGGRLKTNTLNQRKDEFSSPFPAWTAKDTPFIPGLQIQATTFLNLLRGDWLDRLSYKQERSLILLFGLVIGSSLVLLRPLGAVRAALITTVFIAVANYTLVIGARYWFPWLIVAGIQVPLALICSITYNSVQLYVQKRLVEQSLELYLSPKLVKKFAKNPKLLQPGAEKQMLTILFSDIASFTTISEGMDSDELARFMNQYFQNAVTNCIHVTDGTVVKYIGDAIFAFWNAPDPQPDHQYRACEAALRFRDQQFQFHGQTIVTRIGLHTGVANVGNFGSTTRVDYTAIGENINLASRMEGLNKYLGTRVLITAETHAGIGSRLVSRYLGLFRLKGFEKAVAVYELIGLPEQETSSRPLREAFAEALKHFQNKDFTGAKTAFACILKQFGQDGPSTFYLKQIEELQSSALPSEWKGEIELKEK